MAARGVLSSASASGIINRPPLELRDLAPESFARIRDLFGVSPAQFFYSLSRTTRERFSEGASGAFMCFSHDMRYVLKTTEEDEAATLLRMLPEYLAHLRANPESLIIRFYACMSLKLYSTTLFFVVMENIFPIGVTVHERFGAGSPSRETSRVRARARAAARSHAARTSPPPRFASPACL